MRKTNIVTGEERVVSGCLAQVLPEITVDLMHAGNRAGAEVSEMRKEMREEARETVRQSILALTNEIPKAIEQRAALTDQGSDRSDPPRRISQDRKTRS